MTVYVGLLRAVNLGRGTQVRMEDLRALLSRMGFAGVQSLLQSGNVVFETDDRNERALEKRIEDRIARELGLRTDFFVRTGKEWSAIVQGNPFLQEAKAAPGFLVVTVLKETPLEEGWRDLDRAISGRERVRGGGRHAYIVYPDGQGRSRLTPALIEKHLKTRGTNRNWNTVTKLAALSSAP